MTKQAPAGKKTPNRSIFVTILRSMLAVLLVELVLLIGILYFSRVNVQLEQNAADLLQKQVENRQSYLQSLMLSAQDLSTLAGSINTPRSRSSTPAISPSTRSIAAMKTRSPF